MGKAHKLTLGTQITLATALSMEALNYVQLCMYTHNYAFPYVCHESDTSFRSE